MLVVAIWMGGLILTTAVCAYAVTGVTSSTVMVPAVLGVTLVLVTALGLYLPWLRAPALNLGLGIAVVSAGIALMFAVDIAHVMAGTAEYPVLVVVSTIVAVLLSVYIVAGIRSPDVSRG